MTVIPNYYVMTIHIEHQQAELLAEANRDRKAVEAARGAPNRLTTVRHLAVATVVVIFAFLLAVSAAAA